MKALIKADGKMHPIVLGCDEKEPWPVVVNAETGQEFMLVDWCSQFDGPDMPVYEESHS